MLGGDDERDAFRRERRGRRRARRRSPSRSASAPSASRRAAMRRPSSSASDCVGRDADLLRGARRDGDHRSSPVPARARGTVMAQRSRAVFIQCSPLVRSSPASRLPCFCGPPRGNMSCRWWFDAALRAPRAREVADHHAHLRLDAVLGIEMSRRKRITSQCAGVSSSPSRARLRAREILRPLLAVDKVALAVGLDRACRRRRGGAVRAGAPSWHRVGANAHGRASDDQRFAGRAPAAGRRCCPWRALPVVARADEVDEARRPVVGRRRCAGARYDASTLRDDDAVALAVDAVAALDRVGEAQRRRAGSRGSSSGTRARAPRCAPAAAAGHGKRRGLLEVRRSRARPGARASRRRRGSRRPSGTSAPLR